ncbi:MMPL family transporter [Micromonospora sp. HM5-17]|jgi:RND superfamily putative drug exporter|uniref:MMPL family transporter n=1 Tax=Micromonospora sp. HM5-17 TaxID=2487710 RepID=UPI000F46C015|nr:MMPL family transporter [Micromonospora sp. HM5-17]ROT33037.1 MMPL family transporter [Micromonospora sp. HM5-17]
MPDTRSIFARLARWSYRRRWWAVLLWVAVLVTGTVAAQVAGSAYHNDFSLPGTDSQRALDVLRDRAPDRTGATVDIVVQAPAGLVAPEVRPRVDGLLAEVRRLPRVVEVGDPYADPASVSRDGTTGYARVTLDAPAEELPAEDVRRLIDTAEAAGGDGLRVAVGGDPVRGVQEGGGPSEGIGLLAALVVLVLLFGSLLAASLPIVIAIFAVGTAIGATVLASHAATVADFTAPLMVLVGLGVGIDYALLVFSRYRAELVAGRARAEAAETALDTAGRTVFFAGCTVIIALLGLVALGLGSLQGVAVAVALTVLMTMVATLTLLPALLAVVGPRLERAVARRAARAGRAARVEGATWRRWSAAVRRHAGLVAVLSVLALLGLAAPALDLRLGFADAGTDAEGSTSRTAYDLLAEGFGPGVNGPLVVVAQGGPAVAEAARNALASTAGVASVAPPQPVGDGTALLVVVPTSAPQDEATAELVTRLRAEVLPPVARNSGGTLLVGGSTAAVTDFADAVAARLPLFVAVVVGLSALLLLVVFRSVWIPVKAALLNLLSVAAATGVITLVFQHGLLGAEPGPIEAYVPVMIFAIIFGLSMDYEVFLLARMHEEWTRHGDPTRAVTEGLATTGRVVTAAATIMVVVFGAFLFDPSRMLQQFGLGLAVAVAVDAVLIRCLTVPAVMHLLGRHAWWLPRWLERRLPHAPLAHAPAPAPAEAVTAAHHP